MEPVGLAVGVVGLFGLFNTCLDVVKKHDAWKDFGSESRCLTAQFEAQKLRLQNWGEAVGVEQESVSSKHHELLGDPRTRSNIQNLLLAIKDICGHEQALSLTTISRVETGSSEGPILTKHGYSLTSRGSKRQRFNWALRGKERRIAQVAQFSSLVDDLHSLVPVNGERGQGSRDTRGKFGDEGSWIVEFKQLIERIEHDHEARLWFLEWSSPDFPSGPAKFLWINGPAGFGKSILCAKITEYLLLTSDTPTAHFFFSSDFERGDPFMAMRSWLSQLMFHTEALGFIRKKWESTQGQRAARGDVISLLRAIVSAIPECTFTLDGLDECDWAKGSWPGNSDDSITSFLRALRRATAGTSTRILIVSRDEPEIRRGLSNESPYDPVFEHRIIPEDVQNDVLTYCRSIVEEKLSTKTDEAKDEITKKLADRCNGQFLWIRLQQDTLRSGKSQRKLEQAINSTPSGIEHIYERNWMKIMGLTEEDRTRAISLLRWTAFSLRPLTISEISGALVISEDDDELLLDDLPDSIDEYYVNTEIKELCGSLLEVRDAQDKSDARLKTVHLTHFSVKEYLLRNLPIEGKVIENTIIAKKCLRFVNSQEAWLGTSGVQVEEFLSTFRKYAAGSWYRHVELGNMSDTELRSSVAALFDPKNPNWPLWKAWFDANDTKAVERNARCGVATAGPLYYASWLGLTDSVASLIHELKPDVNNRGYDEQTPLGVASEEGNLEIVRTLLEQGADVTMADIDGWTPIYTASHNGHTEVARLLIENGSNVNTSESGGCTPVNTACYQGHVETVKLLLKSGADIYTATNKGITPLYAASAGGHIEVVKLLLKWGADIDYANKYGDTPLSASSSKGHPAVSKLLVETGADIEAKNNFGRTPLHLASLDGHIEIVILLLERDAYVEAKDIHEWTPLMNASFEGHAEVVKALSERGADIEAKSANGHTALMYASTEGHIEVTDIGVTPLMFASSYGHIEVVKLLLKHGADFTNRDITGTTSLHVAAYDGHVKVVEIFLQASSTHVDALNRLNRTPLFQAAARGHLCVVNTLLSHKANAKIKDHYRSTPLLMAVRNGHKDVVGRLITLADSSIHFQNGLDQTLLGWAARCGDAGIVELIVRCAKEHNIEAIESDLQVDGSLVKLGEPSRYCDVCIRDLRANEVYYKFKTCFDFNICSECF
ncbi:ankyrin [Aspergillus flavus]|uniref:Ankyrin n=1 Tax=Aspergillus flavus (strain ATCC 200026 / FGSC A1120 / IAM 13836 / NRRL 3357 / JCM 12722 / SRRC 167) TaxID=332952 RepID=A0A7U2MPN7_ASPFN|nr:ankyrin [Aspergillus flavus]